MTYEIKSKDRLLAVYHSKADDNYYIKDCESGDSDESVMRFATDDRDEAIGVWMMCGGAYGEMEIVKDEGAE